VVKKYRFAWLAILLACAAFSSTAFAQMDDKKMEKPKEKSLYERLGGYDALAAVTDDFIGRLATDEKLAKYFVGLSNDSKKKVRQHVIDFLCLATGGPCAYTGRDMKTSHTGLMITKEEWDISAKLLIATLNKFKVPEKEKGEVLAAVGTLEKDIVEKK
jgi:hemoglobin